MKKGTKLMLLLLILACVLFGIAYAGGLFSDRQSGHEVESQMETGVEAGLEPSSLDEAENGSPVAEETVIPEIEPEENLKDEKLEAEHDDFVNGLAELRTENDEDKTFVPEIIINPEESTVTIGDQVQESAVEEADGEQLIDTGALEEIFEDTNLVVPEGEQVGVEDIVEANDLEMESLEDGSLVLTDTYQTCRIIVKQKDTDNSADLLTDEHALSVVGPYNGLYIFQYETTDLAKEACERWTGDSRVEYATAEKVISVKTKKGSGSSKNSGKSKTASNSKTSGSFSYGNFKYWGSAATGFKHMKSVVKKAYGSVANAPTVKVAVIDTGIDYNHPLFENRLLSKGYDFVNGDNNATDDYYHGTACAGIIARQTSSNVKILPLKAGDYQGSLSDIDIYNALEYCIKKKVDIVSMSFGCLCADYSPLMKNGIDDAYKAGLLLIAAYGNDAVKTVYNMPACFSGVIGVSSVNVDKELSGFSNYGKRVDLCAPGEDIYCAVPKFYNSKRYQYMSGTSMSTPYVAAAAAMFKTLYPKYSAKKIRSLLYEYTLDLGKEGKDIRFGNGMIYLKDVPIPSAN